MGDASGGGSGRRPHSSSSAGSVRSASSREGEGDDAATVNLPVDREFVPLPLGHEPDDAEEKEAEAARDDVRDDVIRMIFDLPRATRFYQDFSCAVAATLAMHGRMYPTDAHVCFYSNVFGRERKILIPYESIVQVAKTTTMVFQNAIRIATDSKDEFTFTSFWGNNRDACYDLIVRTRDRVVSELKPAVARGSRRPNSASSSTSGRSASDAQHGARTPPPATSPHSVSSVKSSSTAGAAAAAASPTHHEETDNADADSDDERSQLDATADVDGGAATALAPQVAPQAAEHENDANDADDADDAGLYAPVRRSSVVSDIGSAAPKDISMTQILEDTFDVSVDEFMAEFFWDGARFGTDAYGVSQGCTEMKCNPWMSPLEVDSSFGMTRSVQFRVPVDAPIGPKSSRVDVLQCAKTAERNVQIIETSTRLVDIPYGDYFSVEDRWTVVPSQSNPKRCSLCIELKVVFSKSTIWKSKIEARAIADNKAKWLGWATAAKQHLAEQHRKAAEDAPSPPPSSESTTCQTGADSEQQGRRSSHRSRTAQAAADVAAAAHHGPSPSFILYLRVFPWILVLGLLFLVVRMQASLAIIEHTLVLASAKVDAIESRLAALSAVCPAA
ncbi:hypothetical protein PybrP1_002958 [[Pythium] brassicae (nom. inval.)]|nr:hypothetical protein PybrP1_002958 [[Pythium] brassicae (nom. inval.)]